MRILLGADTFAPYVNGAARFAERLAAGLAGRGHEVHVAAPSPTGAAGVGRFGDVAVHRVRSHRYPWHESFRVCLPWEAGPATAEILRRVRPDVVHVQAHFVVGRGLAAAAAASATPLVATNHFMPENLFAHARVPRFLRSAAARWAWRDVRAVFGRADAVTAPTPRAVALLTGATGLAASAVSCGIDAARYAGGDERPDTVLFVGRLDQEKRVDELLRAVARVPGARLEVVGDGTERGAWHRLAAELGIADRVVWHGFVSEEDLVAAYRRCAVFCMPGIAELQSLVTLEAMAAGKPVVAADAMALPHLVRPGRNGWLFAPGDVEALAVRLAALLADAGTRRRMGTASREIVAGHTLDATLDAFEDLYVRVAHVPSAGPVAA
ncbi:glycosyltransferase [Pseudonocardia oroxyli]|uniref:Glycosyltransferase involved in cell wall bisynthesis n=1 Tax=Pseudonocardia oroxyli TaxID=366584 RepID=A0A1G7EHQ9_PSEOR|nr:glycosyltransferase [Pseudonocardia oroxyli]SDE63212.1 Glycosyltransferase involved in cell wall bisynthesis [Pseudonocardia oroxyli]